MTQVSKRNLCSLENGTLRKRQAGGIRQVDNLGYAGRTQRGKQDRKIRQTERPPLSPDTITSTSQKTKINTFLQTQKKEIDKGSSSQIN